MKKRVLCLFLAVLFAASVLAGCDNGPVTESTSAESDTTKESETEADVTFDESVEAVTPSPDAYRLGSDIVLADYDPEGTVSYVNKTVEFKDKDSSSDAFGFHREAKSSGGTVTLPKGEVAGLFPRLAASETEKTVYKFDLNCAAPEKDYSWFTFYVGLRLESEGQDCTQHSGVWIAMRSGQIGMRVGDWPNTSYFSCGYDFSSGGTVIVVDDPEANEIKIYAGDEDHELATVRIDGAKTAMYAPGKDKASITDTTVSTIIRGGYAHLWNHITDCDVTLKNVSATLIEKTYVKEDINGIRPNTTDIFSDTYTAYDDVGRTAANTDTAPNGKKVGMFYFLWHEDNNNKNPLYDHTAAYEKAAEKSLKKY